IKKFLNDLMKEYEIITPVRNDGKIEFRIIKNLDEIELKFSNSIVPPKEFFLPEKETILEFMDDDKPVLKENGPDDRKRVIFGIRPCDLNAILLLDLVNSDTIKNPRYFKRRENTMVFSLDCNKPCENSFCFSIGTGPHATEGADVRITEIGNSYLLEPLSKRGKDVLKGYKLRDSSGDDLKTRDRIVDRFPRKGGVDVNKISNKMDKIFDSDFWNKESERCIECFLCTFLCPTCYCFDMTDKKYPFQRSGERVIFRDSCMSPKFTRLAGGENPRAGKRERLRNRFYHKLKYFNDRYGRLGCTGCGRCITLCPVNIDIRELIFE
ncbi:MAG TPA: hypothetical protein EYP86_01300, partial [Candidatus Altiarchaeales archaeon]|nr:hypothetical protein [Candidatus Altiarchaeales archaeon]